MMNRIQQMCPVDIHSTERRKINVGDIFSNAIMCKLCGETIESVHRHDMKFCGCGSVYVDGGTWYKRHGGHQDDYIDKSVGYNADGPVETAPIRYAIGEHQALNPLSNGVYNALKSYTDTSALTDNLLIHVGNMAFAEAHSIDLSFNAEFVQVLKSTGDRPLILGMSEYIPNYKIWSGNDDTCLNVYGKVLMEIRKELC